MQTESVILIGSISVFVIALILGALQVRSMNKKSLEKIDEIRRMSFEPKKSIHEQLEETLAERKKIIEELENK
jgi:F0F1-type ATP synthase membrane subunit b/b'